MGQRIRKAASVLGLCLALWLLLAAASAAQGGISVTENSYESHFAEKVIFHLAAESGATINRIALFRQLVGEKVRVRAEIEFVPDKRVDVHYTWELEPGDLRPGSDLSYYWIVEDAAGNRLQTKPVTFSYDDDRFDWQDISRGQITLFYYGATRARGEEILDAAWDAAQCLQEDIGIVLQGPISIYVYNSQSDMLAALSARGGVYDSRTLTLGVATGGDTLLLLGSHRDVRHTVAHEMSHIVVGLATRNPYTDLPRWLDEGLAMYAEGDLRSDNARALERAIRKDRLISVRSLSSYVGDPDQVDLFYGEVYSLVKFMLDTYGRAKMHALLDALEDGVTPEEALRRAYGFGLDQLDDEWRASLGLGTRAELQATPQTPTDTSRGVPVCAGPLAATWIVAAGLAIVTRHR